MTGRKLRQEVYNASNQLIKESVYAGEFFYEGENPAGNATASLKFVNTEEGRVLLDGTSQEYQYHLKDHLGNVRVTFSTVEQVETFMATMEATEANDEQGEFLRYEESAKVTAQIFDHTHRDGTRAMRAKGKAVANPEVATRLSGIGEERYGLAKSIRVMPGDKVRMEVFAKYIDPKKSDWQGNFSDVVTALRQARPAPALDGALQKAGGASSIPLTAMLAKAPGGKAPKAYLNYVMYDDNFQPIMDPAQTNYVQVTENAKESGRNGDHERLYAEVEVQQAGYLYIYLSNDNYELQGEQVDVFFDDFQIQQVHSKVVQSDDYYPFGLTFNSYSRENSTPNQYKFQGQEQIDDLDLDWVSFKWRSHMPDIGRFFNIDPISEKYYYNSPYAFSENKVISHRELEGLEAESSISGPSPYGQVTGVIESQKKREDLKRRGDTEGLKKLNRDEKLGATGAAIIVTGAVVGGLLLTKTITVGAIIEFFGLITGGNSKSEDTPSQAPAESEKSKEKSDPRFIHDPSNNEVIDKEAIPPGRYVQPNGDETDVLQQSPHKNDGRSHTHEYNVNPNDPSLKSKSNRTHRVTSDEVENIQSGTATPKK